MDKYEYKLRVDEIKELIANRRYREAVEIADTIDWRNVKNCTLLCQISDLYKICKRFDDSREILLLAYQKNPSGRMILYSLCELSIKLNDVVNAVEYYKEYLKVASRDTGKYILQYKLYEIEGENLDERISVLEELQKRECREKWMYELAYLYHRAGFASSCVEECDLVVLYFGEGKYVVKALELKRLHQPLTEEQEALYKKLTGVVEEEIKVPDINVGEYNTIDLQKELANNLSEYLNEDKKEESTEIGESSVEKSNDNEVKSEETKVLPKIDEEVLSEDTKVIESIPFESEELEEPEEPEESEELEESEVIPVDPDVVEVKFEEPSSEVTLEEDGQLSFVDENEKKEEASADLQDKTVIYSKDEIEKALGGSEIDMKMFEASTTSELDSMLSLEGDGQISLVVPEQEKVEKQITGQISIDEVLLEYDRIKRENEERWSKNLRSKIKKQTDSIIEGFDKSIGEGLLEEMEEKVILDPDSVEYGPNLTEEERFILQQEGEIASDDVVIIYEDVEETEVTEAAESEIEKETAEEEFSEMPVSDMIEVVPVIDEETEPIEESVDTIEEAEEEVTEVVEETEEEVAEVVEEAEEEVAEVVEEAEEEVAEVVEEIPEEESETDDKEVTSDEASGKYDYLDNFAAAMEKKDAMLASAKKEASTDKEETADEGEETAKSDFAKTFEAFTREQYYRFESFIQTENGREQILDALGKLSEQSTTGNVIIGSVDTDSAIELGKVLIVEASKSHQLSEKAVKINAKSLNAKDVNDVEATLAKVYGASIIIQDADKLRKETLEGIEKALSKENKQILVIMTMSHRQKHRFIMENADYLSSFNISIDIESLDNQELVRLAKEYAYRREFSIDDMGELALYERIEEKQTNSHNVMFAEVKEIIDEAIAHATKKKVGHLFDVIVGKRYDDNDMIVLREKDFLER